MFLKSNLRNGDFVVTVQNKLGVVTLNTDVIVLTTGKYIKLPMIQDDLTHATKNGLSIAKVYRPTDMTNACFNDYDQGTLVYDRDVATATEMTMAEIKNALGIKNLVIVG